MVGLSSNSFFWRFEEDSEGGLYQSRLMEVVISNGTRSIFQVRIVEGKWWR